MKHSIALTIKSGTKTFYQILMVFGILVILFGIGLALVQVPLIFFSALGLLIFLITYFTVKEVNADTVNLLVEANGDELTVYRENNKGYKTRKTTLKASDLASVKLIALKGAFGITYYCIEARTKAKGAMNNKIIRLLSPVLEANESELLNILNVIHRQYPSIQIGH